MAAIKTISRLATAAFSPGENSIAVGTITGSLDSSFSSSTFVQIHKLDLASDASELPVIGSCATSEALCRLAWSPVTEQYQSGLLAGGLADGCINVWNPATLVSDYQNNQQSAPVTTLEKHKQKVLGLDFNPVTPNLLASGSSDGAVYIWDLADAANAKHFPPLQFREGEGDISYLSWNRKVPNIFATTTYDTGCVIWDLKKQKHVIKFSDPSGSKRYSAIQWNPELSTKLVVAVDDDSAPVLQGWDLRYPSKPFQFFKGHSKGVGSLAWCPSDNSILVSCGKDNRTLFWDVSGQVIGELPNSTWNFDLQWSPRIPGVFSASSHDGHVGIYSIESCHTNYSHAAVLKAPKWLKRPVGASFGFGGKLVTFSTKAPSAPDGVSTTSEVKIHSAAVEEDIGKCSEEFEAAVSAYDRKQHMKSFCDRKSLDSKSEQEREIWAFLKIMLEEDGGRKSLLNQLGFQHSEVEAVADELGEDTVTDVSTSQHTDENSFQVIDDAEDFFENLEEPKEPEVVPVENGNEEEHEVIADETDEDADREIDEKIEQALVVGNFKGAVEHCMSVNRMADALVIAYAGGPALWEKTRNEHIKRNRRSYLQVVSAVATHDLKGLAENRSLATWKETLALLATYCRGEEWRALTDTLATRLDLAGDIQAATVCFICAGNVEKAVEVLSRQLETSTLGQHAVTKLQDLVEKSIVLTLATGQKQTSHALAAAVERYAELLANQGLLESAMVYISLLPGDLPQSLGILQDRIQRNSEVAHTTVRSGFAAPEPTPKPVPSPQFQSRSEYVPQQSFSYSGVPSQPFPGYVAPRNQFVPENQPPMRPLRPVTPPMRPMVPAATHMPAPMPPNTFIPRPASANPVPFNPMTPVPQMNPQQPSRAPHIPFSNPPTAHMFSTPPAPQTNMFNPQVPQTNMFTAPPQPANAYSNPVPQPSMFTTPPPSQAQPLVSHLTEPPTPPTPPPTVQNVDTSNVKDELKIVVEAFKRLFNETADSSKKREREVEDNSRKLGQLFVKLIGGGVSPFVDAKLIQLAQALNGRDYAAANAIQAELTSKAWDECGYCLPALRRMIKSRQAMIS